ncbi:uncharacterized protein CTRU02_215616 [Colletotrichum truncatum]|uniref:Uncharacterized protein n=1 Tax=Colletotrichum truncatum TaxID=5467 RepID=A0ACC3YCA9_COLTU|nr:uncharacterized protein CTRU02_05443 [Colletotrichum truncatum]KAF6793886.1 hypothetical protein CTRU02_05443 [Colletotrichum truncatum]
MIGSRFFQRFLQATACWRCSEAVPPLLPTSTLYDALRVFCLSRASLYMRPRPTLRPPGNLPANLA